MFVLILVSVTFLIDPVGDARIEIATDIEYLNQNRNRSMGDSTNIASKNRVDKINNK